MGIHKLHIFAKNRDAIATQKGYTFQQLKTIEDWIENRIAGRQDVIYCDYEDDIHTQNSEQGKQRFSQIKLYSTKFSFTSESITKAIAHFFMLYVKGEYKFDETEFCFETNTSVAREYDDNRAKLLKEWCDHQGTIQPELMDRIRPVVKTILDDYITATSKELEKNEQLTVEVAAAKKLFEELQDQDIDAFIKCIKWKFDGIDPNTAVERLVDSIKNKIPMIPLPLDDRKTDIYAALLIAEVSNRSIQDNHDGRKLTNDLLDAVLLNAGKENDKWYAGIIQLARKIQTITAFYPGEFQTTISGAGYCRWTQLDHSHSDVWLTLLRKYFELSATPVIHKRRAVYEYIVLKIGHNSNNIPETSPITYDTALVEFYFDNWQHRASDLSIESDIVLLQLVKVQVLIYGLNIEEQKLLQWYNLMDTYLKEAISKEKRVDIICGLLELQGQLAGLSDLKDPAAAFKASYEYYKQIPALLPETHTYSLARLYDLFKTMAKMVTQFGNHSELLELIDAFMEEISEYAGKTGQRHISAHELVERAKLHLKHHDTENYLKALNLLHKAKQLWKLEYTKDGYILSMLGIAQVYKSLGMCYASKYYAMCAFWVTWHSTNPSLYKRLPQAMGQIQNADYLAGAWVSAIDDFNQYLFTKREFDEKGFDIHDDQAFAAAVFSIAAIFQAILHIYPEMNAYIDDLKQKYGFVWTEQIEPTIQELNGKITSPDNLKEILKHNLFDKPLSDIGEVRTIRFAGLNNDWKITFENNAVMTMIGEAFASSLQIFLCEITGQYETMFAHQQSIKINLKTGNFDKEYVGNNNWNITIPPYDGNDQDEVRKHTLYIGSLIVSILQSLTGLSKGDFTKFYIDELLAKKGLGDKVFEGGLYQRIGKGILGIDDAIAIKRSFKPKNGEHG